MSAEVLLFFLLVDLTYCQNFCLKKEKKKSVPNNKLFDCFICLCQTLMSSPAFLFPLFPITVSQSISSLSLSSPSTPQLSLWKYLIFLLHLLDSWIFNTQYLSVIFVWILKILDTRSTQIRSPDHLSAVCTAQFSSLWASWEQLHSQFSQHPYCVCVCLLMGIWQWLNFASKPLHLGYNDASRETDRKTKRGWRTDTDGAAVICVFQCRSFI